MPKTTHYAIDATGLKKSFGNVEVLSGIDLKIEKGTILALLGPNGAGKTTTVRILSTLLKPDAGAATVAGFDITTEADDVRTNIGLTGQYAAVDEYLTGRENLRMMGRLYHLSRKNTHQRADELLEQFDLVDAADRPAKTYSGGMRRRLDLAASLIAFPQVMFLDEPTTGLDPRSRLALWGIIKDLAKQGTTILLTTQYMEEAEYLADRIVVIDGGKVIADGTTDKLKEKIGKERIELTLKNGTDFAKALQIIDGNAAQSDEGRRLISLANDGGVRKLRTVLEKLDKAKIDVEALSLHKPTLDDVFLHLTGHEATKPENEEDEETPKAKARGEKGKK